jgi:hypothetical protein
VLLWLLRATWVALPLTAGSAFAAAFDGRSLPVQTTASVGLWALWAGVLSASLIRLPLTLTIVRVVAPAALVAMLLAELTTGGIRLDLIATIAPLAFAYMPEVGIEFVNGPSYPNERRFPLRPPGLLLLGPVPVAWAVVVGLPAAGALLLAARVWALGAIALAAGAGAVVVLGRSLYGLSRRWIVFVPAGVVIHDPMALADPVLFPREHIVRLALAPVGADERAFDLTMRAFGNAIELDLDEPAPLAMLRGQTAEVQSLLVAPTRPGAVLSYRAMPAPTTASPS